MCSTSEQEAAARGTAVADSKRRNKRLKASYFAFAVAEARFARGRAAAEGSTPSWSAMTS